jgi:hypothetical protein
MENENVEWENTNLIEIDRFEELIRKNIEAFRKNMVHLDGKFIEPKKFSDWMRMFQKWNT